MKRLIILFLFGAIVALSYGQSTVNINDAGVSQIDSNVTFTDLAEDTSPTKAITLDGTKPKYADYADIDTVTRSQIVANTFIVKDATGNDSTIMTDNGTRFSITSDNSISLVTDTIFIDTLCQVADGQWLVVWDSQTKEICSSKPANYDSYFDSNAVALTFPSQYTWVDIDNWLSHDSVNVERSGDSVLINVTGTYQIGYDYTATSAGTNKDYQFNIFVNGVEQDNSFQRERRFTSGAFGSVACMFRTIPLTEGDYIYFGARCISTPVSSLTIRFGGFGIKKIN